MNKDLADALEMQRRTPANPSHLDVCKWYIRNAGATGFGPLASLVPRKIMEIKDHKWALMPGFTERDIEL